MSAPFASCTVAAGTPRRAVRGVPGTTTLRPYAGEHRKSSAPPGPG
ncbi:hypothetical protein [Cryptosporangium japonicum]